MKVLNLTPDSFSDGGKYKNKKNGIQHAKKLLKDGCAILDIGGEATNPESKEIKRRRMEKNFSYFVKIKKIKKICFTRY